MLLGNLRSLRVYGYGSQLTNFNVAVVNSAKHQQLHITINTKAIQDREIENKIIEIPLEGDNNENQTNQSSIQE